MIKLTKRQQEILTLIQSHLDATGSPPTRAEIAKAMGFRSPNAAEDHLRALAKKGVIELVAGTSRGIRLIHAMSGIPIVTQANFHQTLLSENTIQGQCRLDRSFFQPSIDFIWVSQKNIPELNVLEGDYLAIHKTQQIHRGQIVLLRLGQEVFVRRYIEDSQSANFTPEGLVVGVIRSLVKPL